MRHHGEAVKTALAVRHVVGYAVGFTVFILALPASIFFIARFDPQSLSTTLLVPPTFRIAAGLVMLCCGLVFAAWSNIDLFRRGLGGPTDALGVAISPRTRRLVVNGPYRYTRNPMVFGTLTCYFAESLLLDSMRGLCALAGFSAVVALYLKNVEERRLEKDFGDEYRTYRERVPMIVPWRRAGKRRPD
jgi:protein-S-isoprenylcysteine O-methyltransferase Ste14